MRTLLDTHVVLWALFKPSRISPLARKVIEDSANEVFVSALSFWEISLKYQIGKLELNNCFPDDLPVQIERMGIGSLPLSGALLSSSYRLPRDVHKDPFDRLLAWQAIQEDVVLVTKDKAFGEYRPAGLETLW
jgi:PIN domain nuclease of toxin-antitoxin system